jgi:hypothetical protein
MQLLLSLFGLISLSPIALGYSLVREYRGANFFNDDQGNQLWNFYGSWDNLTLCVYPFRFPLGNPSNRCIRLTM